MSVADFSFKTDLIMLPSGTLTTDIGFNTKDSGKAVVVQADAKIIVAGTSGFDFAITRYNSDGNLDSSFGVGGKVVTDIGINTSDKGSSVALQFDGKIVVGGDSIGDFALVRFLPNGALDISFGNNGKVTTDFGNNSTDVANSVAIQNDGKILLAGSSESASDTNFAIARYTTNGSLDPSFGTNGKIATNFLTTSFFGASLESLDSATSVKALSDGKFVVAGYTINSYPSISINFAIARYNNNGTLDSSFGSGGKIVTDFGSYSIGQSVSVQPDGKVLVAGRSAVGDGFILARYNVNGSLDTSFGVGGKVITSAGGLDGGAWDLRLQPDGKIVVAGGTQILSNQVSYVFSMARYNSDGSLDRSFDGDGRLQTNFGTYGPASALEVLSDSKILVVGTSGDNFALARYNSNGSLDAMFGDTSSKPPVGQLFTGTNANDTFVSSPGNDTIDGGAGIDTVTYSGARASFTVLKSGAGFSVSDVSGNQGTDNIVNVERLKFSSGNIALDVIGNAGTVAKIIGSVFGAGVVKSRPDYVGIGLTYLDGGMTYEALAALAIGAAGATTPQQIVNLLWKNVVGTNATAVDAQPYINMLNNGMSVGALGVLASETDLNKLNIDLVGVAVTGVDYI